MKVLMFGWEFPPISGGGLGTACYGLTKGLSRKNVDVTLVLPDYPDDIKSEFAKIISAGNTKIRKIGSILTPYMTSASYSKARKRANAKIYGETLFHEIERYAEAAKKIAMEEDFDVIHCHDWMTFKAGINAKMIKKKPLVLHVHATEFDRTGGNGVNECVYKIEKEGMHFADSIIAVSGYTKNKITAHYGINPEKINVVHNAVEFEQNIKNEDFGIKKNGRVVLFLGRITLQKGPDYFIYAAKKVLEYEKNVKFIIAGSGDMERCLIEKVAEMGIADKVLFAGFLQGMDLERAYRMADVYVMPSVSEPFGITPLEAMSSKVPAIISKNSGVSEVIRHCLSVDFWDVEEISNKIISVLRYNTLRKSLSENGFHEVKRMNWDAPAQSCIDVYNKAIMGIA
ncbi:glycosyltransferase family 4 protein [Candidatus Woesearchaeota archaeon]|nr:glycosyltransferase family 4 protein [Candidatus Woesearchaeota archaeon]